MKKYSCILAALAVIGSLTVSCTKELENPKEADINNSTNKSYTFSIAKTEETKTLLGSDATGRFAQWESGDKIGKMLNSGDSEKISVNTATDPVSFSISDALSENDMLYTYYPYGWDESDPTAVWMSIEKIQHQNAGGFDLDNMPMVGEPIQITSAMLADYSSDDTAPLASVKFSNLGSLINYKVFSTNGSYSSEKVSAITYSAGSSAYITGTVELNLTTVDFADESTLEFDSGDFVDPSRYYYRKGTTVITELDAATSIGANKAGALDVYMVIFPGSYAGKVILETTAARYTYPISSSKTYARSGVKAYGLDLGSANATRTPFESVSITESWEASLLNSTGNNSKFIEDGNSVFTVDGTYGRVADKKTNPGTLYSPIFDMTGVGAGTISFQHTANATGDDYEDVGQVYYRLNGGDWTELALEKPSTNWEWKTASISSSVYKGKTIQFKWVYLGDSQKKWEIKNFNITVPAHSITANGESNPTIELNGDSTISTEIAVSSTYTWSVKSVDAGTPAVFGYTADIENNLLTVTASNDNTTSTQYSIGSIVLTDGVVDCTITFDQGVKGAIPKLSNPSDVAFSSISKTGFTATWTAVANASSYDWILSTASSAEEITGGNTKGSGNVTSATCTGSDLTLTTGTYYLYVKTKGNGSTYDDANGYAKEDIIMIAIDFSSASQRPDGFPTSSGTYAEASYTIDGYTFTFKASSSSNSYYWNASYLIWGKNGGYVLFPAIGGKKLKNVSYRTSGAVSTNVVCKIMSSNGSSTIYNNTTAAAKNKDYSWTLSSPSANTAYRFQVTNAYNMQIVSLVLSYMN